MIYKSIIFALAIFTFSHPESLFSQEIEDGVPISPQTSTAYNCIQFKSGYYKVCDLIQAKVQKKHQAFPVCFSPIIGDCDKQIGPQIVGTTVEGRNYSTFPSDFGQRPGHILEKEICVIWKKCKYDDQSNECILTVQQTVKVDEANVFKPDPDPNSTCATSTKF